MREITITRKTGETENRIYYEFLDFYRNTRLYRLCNRCKNN